jgi:hypothetical protein
MRFVNNHNVSEPCRALKGLALRLRIDVSVRHELQVAKRVVATNVWQIIVNVWLPDTLKCSFWREKKYALALHKNHSLNEH